MGLQLEHTLGHQLAFFSVLDSTPGTRPAIVGADAGRVLPSTSFTPEWTLDPRDDAAAGFLHHETITGKYKQSFGVEAYVIPSGAAGTAPDLGPMYSAAWGGSPTIVPATSVSYAFGGSQLMPTVSMARLLNQGAPIFGEWLTSGVVNEFKLTVSGGEAPKVSWSGQALGYSKAGYGTANGAGSGATSLNVQTGEGAGFWGTPVIDVGSTSNLLVSGVAGDVITIPSSTWADTDVVRPHIPTPTLAGSPIAHMLGSLTLAGTVMRITGLEFTMTHNLRFVEDEAFQATTTDAIRGMASIEVKVTLRARRDQVNWIGRQRLLGTHALTCVMGSTAGSIVTLTTPKLLAKPAGITQPAEEGTIELTFMALDSAPGAHDAATLVFT